MGNAGPILVLRRIASFMPVATVVKQVTMELHALQDLPMPNASDVVAEAATGEM